MTTRRPAEVLVQQLVWLPVGSNTPACDGGTGPAMLPFEGEKIRRVWTLYGHTSQTEPPTLPFVPQHNVNAFLEDHVHDWHIARGQLRYYSRVIDGGCWLLLECPVAPVPAAPDATV